MKSVFDETTREELINRINSLDKNSTALWGENECFENDAALYKMG